jgi:hypothetical protein
MTEKPYIHDGFECWVQVHPSFHWMRTDPKRNYGVGNVSMTFFLRGEKGAIQFKIGTEWGIKPVRDHLSGFSSEYRSYDKPSGWDLGYHAKEPQYEGHSPMGQCDAIGCQCYYDGSGLQADEMIEGFMAGGTAWLWPKLAEVYRARFEEGEWPSFQPEYRPHPDDRKVAE